MKKEELLRIAKKLEEMEKREVAILVPEKISKLKDRYPEIRKIKGEYRTVSGLIRELTEKSLEIINEYNQIKATSEILNIKIRNYNSVRKVHEKLKKEFNKISGLEKATKILLTYLRKAHGIRGILEDQSKIEGLTREGRIQIENNRGTLEKGFQTYYGLIYLRRHINIIHEMLSLLMMEDLAKMNKKRTLKERIEFSREMFYKRTWADKEKGIIDMKLIAKILHVAGVRESKNK